MEIAGVGIDVVEIADVENARFKKRFAEYFLTREETRQIPKGSKEVPFLASRFAAKEAVIKAFPVKLKPSEFTITKRGVKPIAVFASKKYARDYAVQISISHTEHLATALAIVVKNGV